MKLLRYLGLLDRANGLAPEAIVEALLQLFGWHALTWHEAHRIAALTPEEAAREIFAARPETEREWRFVEALKRGLPAV